MTGAALLAAAVGVLALTAVLLAASLGLDGLVRTLLAAYVLAWTELLALAAALSAGGWLTRPGLLAGVAVIAVSSVIVWKARGSRLPRVAPVLETLRLVLRDRAVALLAAVSLCALAYVTALAVLVAPNDGDALAYHLARAALWKQSHTVGWIPNAVDSRLNVNPPNAEIGDAFTMIVARSDRLVGFVELASLLALALAVYGLGRRLRLPPPASVFGALVFLGLPVALIQGASASNDLVVASFLAVAAFFVLGDARLELGLAAVATALALGTKFSAPFSLPLLVLLAVLASRERRLLRLAALALGTLAGSYWYLVNLDRTGSLDGKLASEAGQVVEHSAAAIATTALRYLTDFLDLSGAKGGSIALYQMVGVAAAAGAPLAARRGTARSRTALRAALLIAAVPVAVLALGKVVTAAFPRAFDVTRLQASSWGGIDRISIPTPEVDGTLSSYGPVAALLLVVGTVLVVRETRRGTMPLAARACALAPALLVAIFAVSLAWDPFRARFSLFAVALAAASWGVVLGSRVLAWSTVGLAATTMFLVLVNADAEPSGLRLFDPSSPRSIWSLPRWEQQMILRPGPNGERHVVRLSERAPSGEAIALAVRRNDFIEPYFGAALDRTVALVLRDGGLVPAATGRLVTAPGTRLGECRGRWAPEHAADDGWLLLRRARPGPCRLARRA